MIADLRLTRRRKAPALALALAPALALALALALARAVDHVDHQDVHLLRTFISDRGKIRSRRITGITPRQQRLVTRAVENARETALLCSTTTQRS